MNPDLSAGVEDRAPVASRALLAIGLLLGVGEAVFGISAFTDGRTLGIAHAMAAAGVFGAVSSVFVRKSRDSYLLAVAALGGLAIMERLLLPNGVTHGKLLPAAVALAITIGQFSPLKRRGAQPVELAAGVVAAAYLLAAIAKLRGAGFGWFSADYLSTLLIERAWGAPAWLHDVRMTIAGSPALCRLFSVGSIAIEGGAFLFLWPRGRVPFAVLATLLHAGIAVSMGYVYAGWVAVVWAVALSGRMPPSPAHPPHSPEREVEHPQRA